MDVNMHNIHSYIFNGDISVTKTNSVEKLEFFLALVRARARVRARDPFCHTTADAFVIHIFHACFSEISVESKCLNVKE